MPQNQLLRPARRGGPGPPPLGLLHRTANAVIAGEPDGVLVPGIGVADDAHPRIARQNALETAIGVLAAVGHYHHPGVLRVADSDAAAIVNGYPRRACRRIHK